MTSPATQPVDPSSARGQAMADRLTNTLADIRLAIAERRRATQRTQRGAA